PRLLNPSIPRDLETICLKCLEKETAKRYATGKEVADELDRFLRDEPIQAHPVTRSERVWRWCRRNPVVASLSGATALLIFTVAIGAPIAAFRIQGTAETLRRNLYVTDMGHAWRSLQEHQTARTRELLHDYAPANRWHEDLRGFEWRLLWQLSAANYVDLL